MTTIQAEQQVQDSYLELPDSPPVKEKKKRFKPQMVICSLCQELTIESTIRKLDGLIELCPHCFNYVKQVPDGILKDSIKRFMIGNVI